MGGKTGTSTSSVAIPPEVLARYNAVNAQAEQVASTPFQRYTGQFVAGLTPTQQAGINATSQYSQMAQPYYQAAAASALSGSQPVNPQELNVSQYMSPYTSQVAEATANMLRQQQGQQTTQQQANAVMSGAFGGDRANLAAAQLAGQQNLAMAQAMAPIYQQGYQQALGAAQQQQGVYLTADQANRAAQMQVAAQLGQLGTGAQQAALQGAQAQLGAGTLEQQTQQADLTAQYQQFLQERGYPFQVAQFLANIAMGTGALSGSTTTSTYPMPFFSDRRLKEDVKEIGETHDGQPIYSFKYKGKPGTQIGLMAQDVEKLHPDAVQEIGGLKAVDYKEATRDAERPEKYAGGIVPESMGGAVNRSGSYARGGYADGGLLVDPNDLQALLAQQQSAFGPFGEGGIYGKSQHETPFSGGKGIVPQSRLHVPKMLQAGTPPKQSEGLGEQAVQAYDQAMGMKRRYDEAKKMFGEEKTPQQKMDENRQGQTGTSRANLAGPDIIPDKKPDDEMSLFEKFGKYTGLYAQGGIVPRHAYALAGSVTKEPVIPGSEMENEYFPTDILDVNTASNQTEAPKTQQPTSQTGIGLGTLLGLFLKDGGSVPRHRYEAGGIASRGYYDISEKALQDFTHSRADELGLDPDFAVKVFRGESGFRPHAIGDDNSSFNVPQLHYGNVSDTYKNPGLGDEFTKQTGLDARDPKNAREAIDWSLKYVAEDPSRWKNWTVARNLMNDSVPSSASAGEGSGIRPTKTSEASEPSSSFIDKISGLMPSFSFGDKSGDGSFTNYLKQNQGWMVPIGAGLRGMVQSKSPFLGGALLEGLGTGMEAVGTAQKQLADIDQVQAAVRQTLSGINSPLIGMFDKNGNLVYDPKYKFMPDFNKSPTEDLGKTQEKVIEQTQESLGQEPTAPTETTAPQETTDRRNPIVVKTDGNQYDWDIVPTDENLKTFASFGYRPSGNPEKDAIDLNIRYQMQPDFANGAAKDAEIADKRMEQSFTTSQTKRETNALTSALMNLPDPGSSVVGSGPGFDERVYAANVYNWVAKYVGAEPERFDDTVKAQEIAKKIKVLLGSRTTSQQGFTGQALAEDITRALPGGDMTIGARAEMLASMWVANQEAEDFARYYQNYVRKFKTTYGVNAAFQKEMAPKYDAMKAKIKEAILPMKVTRADGKTETVVDENGMPFSQYNVLMNDQNPVEFDGLVQMPGLARVFRGG